MNVNANSKRIDDLFTTQIKFLMLTGQMPQPLRQLIAKCTGWQRLSSLLAFGFSGFTVFQSLHLALLFIKTTYDQLLNDGKLETITDALALAIIYSFSAFATIYWWCLSPRVLNFLQRINAGYRLQSLPARTFVSMHAAYARTRRYTILWQVSCFCGCLLWALTPLFMRVRTLPLNCWYPFDVLPTGRYVFLYLLQIHAQVNMGSTFGTSGTLLFSVVITLLAQFDILYCSLKNLHNHALLRCGLNDEIELEVTTANDQSRVIEVHVEIKDKEERNQYLFSKEAKTDVRLLAHLRCTHAQQPSASASTSATATAQNLPAVLHDSLVDCVRQHIHLTECCAELEALFHPLCLVKSIQITLQLCLLVFVGVESNASSIMATLNLVQYVLLTLIELVMFTYCGELLRNHSVRAADAFGRSPWWAYASSMRQDLLIFLINSRRAVHLTAGKFYTMDVERLRLVLTQAISFLTLLQKLAKKRT